MPDWEDRPLDEYEAEAFMRRSERRARKLQRLYEKYHGDPDADRKIAEEMGWKHLLDPPVDVPDGVDEPGFEEHPLYRKGMRYAVYALRVLRAIGPKRSRVTRVLGAAATQIGAKLAAGLGRIGDDEIGFSIAYLKATLRASHHSLQALKLSRERNLLPPKAIDHLTTRLIDLRDDIVGELMSLRGEWDSKFGR